MKPTTNTIVHIIPKANLGGIEKDLWFILKAETGKYQHKILVLDKPGPMSKPWEDCGASIHYLNILHSKPFRFVSCLKSEMGNAMGVMCWSPTKIGLVAYALRHIQAKVMLHLGNPAKWSLKSILANKIFFALAKPKFQLKLFCCSQHVLKSLSSNSFLKQFDAVVSYNPVKLLTNNPFAPESRTKTLGMIARMDAIKDFDTVIRAMSHLPKDIQLHLGGDGTDKARLESLAKAMAENRIRFQGFVKDVAQWFTKITVFVYGTTMQEGLGNVVTEAMANGVPCVLPNLPMMKEIAGDNALYYQQGDAEDCAAKINILLADVSLQKQLSEKGFYRAKTIFNQSEYYRTRVGYLESKL